MFILFRFMKCLTGCFDFYSFFRRIDFMKMRKEIVPREQQQIRRAVFCANAKRHIAGSGFFRQYIEVLLEFFRCNGMQRFQI